uniref:Carboxylic ester hydrolase n=1 Tax=Ganoderma boninense TaxID=34458 RepID=A0A5K1JXH8_9APHY|nr:Carboxylic ester hydrolase (EC [Ganoderma boninense]
MVFSIHISRALLLLSLTSVAVSSQHSGGNSLDATPPTVVLDKATVVGKVDDTTGTIQFLGIPFAEPPVGNLRLRLPVPLGPYGTGTINATTFGNQCVQQVQPAQALPSGFPSAGAQRLAGAGTPPPQAQVVPQDEDCLNVNVIMPANVTADSKLPVALGTGENVVQRSVQLDHPLIFVAPNYRLNAFGFLGGKELKAADATNLGLHDQRVAFRWVQKYISQFGGDPTKVMIWGESAGAQSVGLQMLVNGGDTEGLFRAAFMESGAPTPEGFVDNAFLQATFDQFVIDAGCGGSADPVACLRTVSVDAFTQAANKAPTLFSFMAMEPPERQVLTGRVANIPFVSGNQKDEGTLFSFDNINITTDDEFFNYVQSSFFPNVGSAKIKRLLELYPSDPAAGSPFGTGDNFAFTPEFKRMAALQGDLLFIAPRRLLTKTFAERQPVFSFYANQSMNVQWATSMESKDWASYVSPSWPPHASDLQDVFGPPGQGNLQDYLIRFATTLDPNGDGAVVWPRYTNKEPSLLTLNDGDPAVNITLDVFRAEAMAFLTELCLEDPM